jgi:hypothetical protein
MSAALIKRIRQAVPHVSIKAKAASTKRHPHKTKKPMTLKNGKKATAPAAVQHTKRSGSAKTGKKAKQQRQEVSPEPQPQTFALPAKSDKAQKGDTKTTEKTERGSPKKFGPRPEAKKGSDVRLSLTPTCYIAGKRAKEFVDFVNDLCNVADSLMAKKVEKRVRRYGSPGPPLKPSPCLLNCPKHV